uniref:Phosphatidylinositol-3-phosphatase n=1 Tax=Globodera rostochiensis TaxID=31243 RepID=A0A914GS41_GLORO
MSLNNNRFSYNQAVGLDDIVQRTLSFSPNYKAKTGGGSSSDGDNSFHFRDGASFSSDGTTTIVVGPAEFEKFDWLLAGEQLKHKEPSVAYERPDRPGQLVVGQVVVTNYRLRFESAWPQHEPISFDVTLGCVSKVDKVGFRNMRRKGGGPSGGGDPYGIELSCKDMRNVRFIHRREAHSRRALYNCLRKYAFPNTNRLPFFATLYCERFSHDGWALFDVVREFERQKVPLVAWLPSRINADYKFAGTYPSLFYVPSEVLNCEDPDDFLCSVSGFRSKKRIPVLSWFDCRSCAALVRSSQPMVGALSRKSADDEVYVEMIIAANPNSASLVILDARPKINARANMANGGGFEDYPRCAIQFMEIQNIHEVRKSLRRLKDACFPRIRQKYFQHTLEEAAAQAAREIRLNGNSVLVHCSDGWDRTAQITSLAMLQLDQFYRTIEGFAVLVEKEWCSFGHKFAQRIGHGQEKPDDAERSPIFVQFIDCVWQLYNQFTAAFEFNVRFLKTLLDELYSCRFGTFLYNNERERHDLEVKLNTVSLWSFILDNKQCFVNSKYDPEANLDDLIFQQSLVHPLFWTAYYCRYSQLVPHENEDLLSIASSSKPNTPSSQAPPNEFGIGMDAQKADEKTESNGTSTCRRSSAAKMEIERKETGATSARQRAKAALPAAAAVLSDSVHSV